MLSALLRHSIFIIH